MEKTKISNDEPPFSLKNCQMDVISTALEVHTYKEFKRTNESSSVLL